MPRSILPALAALFLFSCKPSEDKKMIIIEGDVAALPDGKVYLTEAHDWMTHLDSTVSSNGKFSFRIPNDSNFCPFMASIYYPDTTSTFGVSTLNYTNMQMNAFYLEPGICKIVSDTRVHPYRLPSKVLNVPTIITAGKQTAAMQYFILRDVKWMNNPVPTIKKYSYSYYVLETLFNIKKQYTKDQWGRMLSFFDKDVRDSKLGQKVDAYLKVRPEANALLSNYDVLDGHGNKTPVIDGNAEKNLIIFWASWCKPCRNEIPSIKKMYERLKSDPSIRIVSISLDEDPDEWKTALAKEKMNWTQLVTPKGSADSLMWKYNFDAIPFMLLTDKNGRELNRLQGYEPGRSDSLYEYLFVKK